jgi:alkanesulfonate monooxygenase SsuD/methylene tetrahydromethanopterin reductase-like flavin-dependent oxidoreductase (luciferase family)
LSQNVKFGVDASLESYQAKTWDQYQDFVKTIDEKTWDSIWLGDHLGALPPISPYRNYNIWPLLGTFAQFKKKLPLAHLLQTHIDTIQRSWPNLL